MLQRKQSGLKLNSYKIDTDQLQNSLRELSEMKQSMETTISHYKENEDQLMLQNQRLKQQIAMLQKKTENKPDYSNFQTKILKLEEQLKDQKKQTDKSRKMCDAQRRSKQIIVAEYEAKLKSQLTESKIQIDNYQQRIAALTVQLKQSKFLNEINERHIKQLTEISKSQFIHNPIKLNMMNKKDSDSDNFKSESDPQYTPRLYSRNSMPNTDDYQKPGSLKIVEEPKPKYTISMPPKSPSSRQYKTSKQISQEKQGNIGIDSYSTGYMPKIQDQQIFLAAIRKLYHEIKEMGLSPNEIKVLPQFKKMAAIENPSRNDLLMFFKQSPIEQSSKQNAQRSCRFIENAIKSRNGQFTGKLVTEIIIARVQDYENSSKLNTDDLEISGMTPSISKGSSYGHLSNGYEERQQRVAYSYHNTNSRASIHDNINFNLESEHSHF